MPSADPSPTSKDEFDVVTTYNRLLAEDPDLTMPVAAIETLVEALSRSRVTTISETLDVLQHATDTLKSSIPNPISLSAGTDLFTRYLVASLKNVNTADADFAATRTNLLSNGQLFVERAKASRDRIAGFGRHFVRDGCTVLTNGGSRVVSALLRSAAEASSGSVRFKVIYVLDQLTLSQKEGCEGTETVELLRKHGIPVATIPSSAVAYSLGMVSMVIVGAEGVVENGGIISRLGTYQLGLLAKSKGIPFYVVAESHKFVRLFPLGQMDLGVEQRVVDFRAEEKQDEGARNGVSSAIDETGLERAVDFTVSAVFFLIALMMRVHGLPFSSPPN